MWAYTMIASLLVVTSAAILLVVLLRDRVNELRSEVKDLRERNARLTQILESYHRDAESMDRAVDATRHLLHSAISASCGIEIELNDDAEFWEIAEHLRRGDGSTF
jgi:hypothetical protein